MCSDCAPAIVPRGPRGDAWLVASGLYVWQAVAALESGARPQELGLSAHEARLAIEYRERDPELVDAAIAAAGASAR